MKLFGKKDKAINLSEKFPAVASMIEAAGITEVTATEDAVQLSAENLEAIDKTLAEANSRIEAAENKAEEAASTDHAKKAEELGQQLQTAQAETTKAKEINTAVSARLTKLCQEFNIQVEAGSDAVDAIEAKLKEWGAKTTAGKSKAALAKEDTTQPGAEETVISETTAEALEIENESF